MEESEIQWQALGWPGNGPSITSLSFFFSQQRPSTSWTYPWYRFWQLGSRHIFITTHTYATRPRFITWAWPCHDLSPSRELSSLHNFWYLSSLFARGHITLVSRNTIWPFGCSRGLWALGACHSDKPELSTLGSYSIWVPLVQTQVDYFWT